VKTSRKKAVLALTQVQLEGVRDLVVVLAQWYPRREPRFLGLVDDALHHLRDELFLTAGLAGPRREAAQGPSVRA
jgi:hypothetical protein